MQNGSAVDNRVIALSSVPSATIKLPIEKALYKVSQNSYK
jgi:hypothetical protein